MITENNKNKKELKKTMEYKTDILSFDGITNKVSSVFGESKVKGDIKTKKYNRRKIEKAE